MFVKLFGLRLTFDPTIFSGWRYPFLRLFCVTKLTPTDRLREKPNGIMRLFYKELHKRRVLLKRFLSLLSISLLALILAVPAFAASKPIDVYINGSKVSFPAGSPYLANNSVLVPFRVVFEKLGLQVLWDAKTGTVTGKVQILRLPSKLAVTALLLMEPLKN